MCLVFICFLCAKLSWQQDTRLDIFSKDYLFYFNTLICNMSVNTFTVTQIAFQININDENKEQVARFHQDIKQWIKPSKIGQDTEKDGTHTIWQIFVGIVCRIDLADHVLRSLTKRASNKRISLLQDLSYKRIVYTNLCFWYEISRL